MEEPAHLNSHFENLSKRLGYDFPPVKARSTNLLTLTYL